MGAERISLFCYFTSPLWNNFGVRNAKKAEGGGRKAE